jgi:hypothetical protein
MNLLFPDNYEKKKIFLILLIISLTVIIIQTAIILILNSGHFTYIVDDSYIHLALAENILRGHYGVNLGEYSSPSSSILWPFLLAPFSGLAFGYWMPFIINTFSAIGTLYIYSLIIKSIFHSNTVIDSKINNVCLLLVILLMVVTNLIGSVFGGMEHPLQVFLTSAIIWGLIRVLQNKQISKWLFAAIIISPLIRYENLALSFMSLFFLYFQGYRKKSVISFAAILLLVGGFSVFLLNLGLKVLPFSVLAKLSVTSSNGNILSILENFKNNLLSPRCALLFIGMLFLLNLVFTAERNREERLLAGCVASAILLHLLFGKDGRYVVYIWTATALVFLFFYRSWLIETLTRNGFSKAITYFIIVVLFVSYNYVYGTIMIPVSSNNIFEQQYQMHRFVTEYYKNPVAVNDLGYVAFKNNNYVLDLVGLASIEVQNLKRNTNSPSWMNKVADSHNVKFAMIYDKWFKELPPNWHKVAELYLSKIKMAPAESVVAFYILDNRIVREVISQLKRFKKSLPRSAKLITWE